MKRPPEVRVSKILAGQEADKTNLLLQTLAEAISANVDSNDVVRKALQSLGEGNENEEPARPSERSRERRESEQTEKPSASTSGDRVRTAKADRAPKSTENEEAPSDKRGSSREASRVRKELCLSMRHRPTEETVHVDFSPTNRNKRSERQVVIRNDDEVHDLMMTPVMRQPARRSDHRQRRRNQTMMKKTREK